MSKLLDIVGVIKHSEKWAEKHLAWVDILIDDVLEVKIFPSICFDCYSVAYILNGYVYEESLVSIDNVSNNGINKMINHKIKKYIRNTNNSKVNVFIGKINLKDRYEYMFNLD